MTTQTDQQQPPEEQPAKRRGGAPAGNLNRLKNGTRLAKRLVVGELPATMAAVKREAWAYRRDIESAVLDAKGAIDTLDAHRIDTASAATVQAGVCRWLLRNRLADMTVADIRGCVADIVKAKQCRDAAIRALQLDHEPRAPWTITVPAASTSDTHSDNPALERKREPHDD